MITLEFSWVAGDFVDTGDTKLRSETLLIPLALLSSRLSFYEIQDESHLQQKKPNNSKRHQQKKS